MPHVPLDPKNGFKPVPKNKRDKWENTIPVKEEAPPTPQPEDEEK